MAPMSTSIASSGSGGIRSVATDPPGDASRTARSVACLASPTTSRNASLTAPYAASSASPLASPNPSASTRLPPSTNARTTAPHPCFALLKSTCGRDELTNSSINRPSSASVFLAARALLGQFADVGRRERVDRAVVATRSASKRSKMANRCASFLLKSIAPPYTSRTRSPLSLPTPSVVAADPGADRFAAAAISSSVPDTNPRSIQDDGICARSSQLYARLCGGPWPWNDTWCFLICRS